jgi:predicted transcriptional regulator
MAGTNREFFPSAYFTLARAYESYFAELRLQTLPAQKYLMEVEQRFAQAKKFELRNQSNLQKLMSKFQIFSKKFESVYRAQKELKMIFALILKRAKARLEKLKWPIFILLVEFKLAKLEKVLIREKPRPKKQLIAFEIRRNAPPAFV